MTATTRNRTLTRRASAFAALLLCALAAAPLWPAADARAHEDRRIRVFKVTTEGSGTFEYDLLLPLGAGLGSETHRNVSFGWKMQLPTVAFLANGEGIPVNAWSGVAEGAVTGTATEETTIVGSDGRGGTVTTHGFCEAKDQSQPPGVPTITPDPLTGDPNAAGSHITVAPFSGIAFPANCTAAIYNGKGQLAIDVAPEQFHQRFFLPTEATRQGKIIQLVQASPAQKDKCAATVGLGDCKFDWKGTLTFEFAGYLGEGELTEGDLPELPPGGGLQAPQTAPPSDEDLIVPLPSRTEPVPSRAKLSSRGDRASVDVTCPAACRGTVRAYAAPRGARAAAAAKPLASARFNAQAGRRVTVRLRFRGAARRKVRRAKAVRLVIDTGAAKSIVVARAR